MKSTKSKKLLYSQKLNSVRHYFSSIGALVSVWVLHAQQSLLIQRCYQLTQGLHEGASCCPSFLSTGTLWQRLTKAEIPAYLNT